MAEWSALRRVLCPSLAALALLATVTAGLAGDLALDPGGPAGAETVDYAAPSGAGSTCTSAAPCSLAEALSLAGSAGGTVQLLAGAYVISTPLRLDATNAVSMVGSTSGSTLLGSASTSPLIEISGSGTVTVQALQLSEAPSGAISAAGGSLTVEDSTFNGDGSLQDGPPAGAIDFSPAAPGSQLQLEGDTFFGDLAGTVLVEAGSAAIEGSSFVGDAAASGPAAVGGRGAVALQADLFARDGDGACRSGASLASGVLVVAGTCDGAPSAPASKVFPGATPRLGSNGGAVPTVEVSAASSDPALTAVSASRASIVDPAGAFCSLPDARGIARQRGGAASCATGALQPDPPLVTSLDPATGGVGSVVTLQGSGLSLVTSVKLETVSSTFQAHGDASLTFTVPNGLFDAKAPLVLASPDGTTTTSFVLTGPFVVATMSLPSTEVGATYQSVVSADGGVGGNHWSASGLPPGLTLAANGLLYGRPSAAGTSSVVISVSDNAGDHASATLPLVVDGGPVVTTSSLPLVHVGSSFAVALRASGGRPPYHWSVPQKSPLPGGFLLSSNGVLTGRPTRTGTQTIVVQVGDSAGGSGSSSLTLEVTVPPPPSERYALVAPNGWVAGYGSVRLSRQFSAAVGRPVAIAADPVGGGYWLLTASGRVIGIGGARTLGSLTPPRAAGVPVGIAAEPGGTGYWVADADGQVFNFGGAPALGASAASTGAAAASAGATTSFEIKGRVVAIAADPRGVGYWLLEANGRVDAFGSARSFGWVAKKLHVHAVGLASVVSGAGYYVLTAAGRVYDFGTAKVLGPMTRHPSGRYAGIAGSPVGVGYWLVTTRGAVVAVGSARDLSAWGPAPLHAASAIAGGR